MPSVMVAMPMVPAKESWKLTSRASAGFKPSITAPVSASEITMWLSRRRRPAMMTSAPMAAARSAAADAPASRA